MSDDWRSLKVSPDRTHHLIDGRPAYEGRFQEVLSFHEPGLAEVFDGPVAVALGYGEVTDTAKAVADYARAPEAELSIRAGFMADRILTAQEVNSIATLPSREVLLARVVGGVQAPIWGLVNCLASPLRGLAGVLQARIEQLEGA